MIEGHGVAGASPEVSKQSEGLLNGIPFHSVLNNAAPRNASSSVHAPLQKVIDALTEQVALLDRHWKILAVNQAWGRAMVQMGHEELQIQGNYFDFIQAQAAKGHEDASIILTALVEITQGKRTHFQHLCSGNRRRCEQDYQISISIFESNGEQLATISQYDVTELLQAKRPHHGLGSRLLQAQEDERRRVARDLHDSTAQHMIALHLSLARLKRAWPEQGAAAFAEVDDALNHIQREIRALSFICHPPPLGSEGLGPALEMMAKGFGQRTGLRIELSMDDIEERAPTIEAALYRFAQEALTNIYRHAKATFVQLRLIATRKYLHLIVKDDGIGFDFTTDLARIGVGIAGMKERLGELSGRLSMHRLSSGMMLIASVPQSKLIQRH